MVHTKMHVGYFLKPNKNSLGWIACSTSYRDHEAFFLTGFNKEEPSNNAVHLRCTLSQVFVAVLLK